MSNQEIVNSLELPKKGKSSENSSVYEQGDKLLRGLNIDPKVFDSFDKRERVKGKIPDKNLWSRKKGDPGKKRANGEGVVYF